VHCIRVTSSGLRCLLRHPRSEPDRMTRPVSRHNQPHIRSPFVTAAPTSRLRRARLMKTKPFYETAIKAMGLLGSPTWIHQE
jgi:hypothetical protein